jgi:hypothetical protein
MVVYVPQIGNVDVLAMEEEAIDGPPRRLQVGVVLLLQEAARHEVIGGGLPDVIEEGEGQSRQGAHCSSVLVMVG